MRVKIGVSRLQASCYVVSMTDDCVLGCSPPPRDINIVISSFDDALKTEKMKESATTPVIEEMERDNRIKFDQFSSTVDLSEVVPPIAVS